MWITFKLTPTQPITITDQDEVDDLDPDDVHLSFQSITDSEIYLRAVQCLDLPWHWESALDSWIAIGNEEEGKQDTLPRAEDQIPE